MRPLEVAAIVTVPETSVHEYHGAMAWKHQVGPSRQSCIVQSKSKAHSMQSAANQEFRFRILCANSCHHPASCGTVDYVRHKAILAGFSTVCLMQGAICIATASTTGTATAFPNCL